MQTIGLILLMAFLSVLTLGGLVALVNDGRSSKSKGGGMVFLFFVVMAFFLWNSMTGSSEDDSDPKPTTSYEERVSKKEPVAVEKTTSAVSPDRDSDTKARQVAVRKPAKERDPLKILCIPLMAFLPAVLYLLFIVSSDKKKPEPVPVLLLAVFIGTALAVVGKFMDYTLSDCGLSLISDVPTSLNIGFIRIAIPSEVAKWLLLIVFLMFNKYYDEYLDGIVYAVCVSMGFACVQCVDYMIHFMDSITSTFYIQGVVTFLVLLPLSMMVGAVMGYFIALARHRHRFLNYVLSLALPLILSGVCYSILAYLADELWQYIIFVLILTPLSAVVYWQMWHLMKLDAKKSS